MPKQNDHLSRQNMLLTYRWKAGNAAAESFCGQRLDRKEKRIRQTLLHHRKGKKEFKKLGIDLSQIKPEEL